MSVGKFCVLASIYLAWGYALPNLGSLVFSNLIRLMAATSLRRLFTADDVVVILQTTRLVWWAIYIATPLLLWLLFSEPRRVREAVGRKAG